MKRCGLLLLALSLVFGAMSLAALSSVRAGASQNTPVSASTKTATSNLSDDQLAAAKAPPCQKDWLCEAVPCATAPSCGVIEAGPMTDLGPNQYVYVNLYGFAPQTSVQLYYCKDTASLSTPARCPLSSSQLMQNPFTILTTMDDGTSSYGFQVVEADPGGAAFAGETPGDTATGVRDFFCDNTGKNNCAIYAVVPSLSNTLTVTPNPQNTLVMPISFRNLGTACSAAKQVIGQGEFGTDLLLAATDKVICAAKGADASIPFETSINGLSALQQLEKGSIQIAFTDDPQALSQKAIIDKNNFLAIPLAASANVLGGHIEMTGQAGVVPQVTTKLTANMAAGLMTGAYSQAGNADVSACGANLCPWLAFLNYTPGFQSASDMAAFIRSDKAGPTDQMFSYFCAMAPMDLSITLGTTQLAGKEDKTAEEVLKSGVFPNGGAPSECLNTDQFPPLLSTNPGWGAYSTVDQQALKMAKSVPAPGATATALAGYAPVNWGVSQYYGMQVPAMQNAANAFVAPSTDAVLKGIADGSWADNGVWTPSLTNTKSASAYSMPTVLYAVVPRNNISSKEIDALKITLSQITETVAASGFSLPAGFVKLDPAVYIMSNDEIQNGIGNANYKAPLPGHTTPTPPSSGSNRLSSGSMLKTTKVGGANGSQASEPTPSSSPTYGPLFLSATAARMVLPFTVGLGFLIALLGGAMILSSVLSGRAARRVSPVEGDLADDAVAEGDDS
jgi:hypothetical protein